MRRLGGGEGRIRTPGTASASMGGIRPELGPLLEPKKSIRAGENLFAWNSALFWTLSGSLHSSGRCKELGYTEHPAKASGSNLPAWAGSQQLESACSELHETAFARPPTWGTAQSRWRRQNEDMMKEGEGLSSRTTRLWIRHSRTEMIDCANVSMSRTLWRPVPKL